MLVLKSSTDIVMVGLRIFHLIFIYPFFAFPPFTKSIFSDIRMKHSSWDGHASKRHQKDAARLRRTTEYYWV